MKLHLIYIHGLDSSSLSIKSQLLKAYATKHHPNIKVYSPDLNMPPPQVVELLTNQVNELKKTAPVVLIGSSLGGFFSTFTSNVTGCPALLLNPSTKPEISLQRFFEGDINKLDDNFVGIETQYGWKFTIKDLKWFMANKLTTINHADNIKVLLKTGDEILDYSLANQFYNKNGVNQIDIQQGGDHIVTDFAEQLPMVMQWVKCFEK